MHGQGSESHEWCHGKGLFSRLDQVLYLRGPFGGRFRALTVCAGESGVAAKEVRVLTIYAAASFFRILVESHR